MSAVLKDVPVAQAPARAPVLKRRDGLRIVRRFLRDLEEHHLEVVLIPSKHWEIAQAGGRIRAVQSENPKWYQEFCALYQSRRGRFQKRCEWCGGIHDARKNNRCLRRKRVRPYTRDARFDFDTAIKRRDTIRGLDELLSGRCESVYAHRLRDFILTHWSEYL